MLFMQLYLVIDFLFISRQLLLVIAIVFTIFGNAKMLKISNLITLSNREIRSVWLSGLQNMVFVWPLIPIINLIKI